MQTKPRQRLSRHGSDTYTSVSIPKRAGMHATGEKIAVEVDGPHHFTANGQRPLGEMRARHRLLEVRGWSVLSVPYFIWSPHTDDAAHMAFLRQVCAVPLNCVCIWPWWVCVWSWCALGLPLVFLGLALVCLGMPLVFLGLPLVCVWFSWNCVWMWAVVWHFQYRGTRSYC